MIDKYKLLEHIEHKLEEKYHSLQMEISQLREEKASETKSSAGDKYETSREMLRQTQNQLETQSMLLKQQINQVKGLKSIGKCRKVENGALVYFKDDIFFFGTSLGKIDYNDSSVFVLSLNAPFAKVCINMKKGEHFTFNNKSFLIEQLF